MNRWPHTNSPSLSDSLLSTFWRWQTIANFYWISYLKIDTEMISNSCHVAIGRLGHMIYMEYSICNICKRDALATDQFSVIWYRIHMTKWLIATNLDDLSMAQRAKIDCSHRLFDFSSRALHIHPLTAHGRWPFDVRLIIAKYISLLAIYTVKYKHIYNNWYILPIIAVIYFIDTTLLISFSHMWFMLWGYRIFSNILISANSNIIFVHVAW